MDNSNNFSNVLNGSFNNQDNNKSLHEFINNVETLDTSIVSYRKTLKTTQTTQESFSQNLSAQSSAIEKVATKSKVASMAMKGLSAAGNMVGGMIVDWALNKIVSGIDSLVHKTENTIKSGKEAQSTIKGINDTFISNSASAKTLAEKYDQLAKGVDSVTGKNRTLSEDDYSQFLSVNQQLLDIFPSLNRMYDENGNAFIKLDSNVSSFTSSLESMLDTQRQIADQQIVAELPDAFEGALEEVNQYNEKIGELKQRRKELQSLFQTDLDANKDSLLNEGVLKLNNLDLDNAHDIVDGYIELINNAGIAIASEKWEPITEFKDNLQTVVGYDVEIQLDSVKFNENKDRLQQALDSDVIYGQTDMIDVQIETLENGIKESWNSLGNSLTVWMENELVETKVLTDRQLQALKNVFYNIDWSSPDLKINNIEDAEDHIKDKVLPLIDNEEYGNEILNFLNLDKTQLDASEYVDIYNNMINSIKESYGEGAAKDVEKGLSSLLTDSNNKIEQLENMRSRLNREFENTDGFDSQTFEEMSDSDVEIAYDLVVNDNFSGTFNELETEINHVKDLAEIEIRVKNTADDVESLTGELSILDKVLNGQETGKSISLDEFNLEDLKDYQGALEYVNGTMQINREVVSQLAKTKADETLATIEANKAHDQDVYDNNSKIIDNLMANYENLTDSEKNHLSSLQDDQAALESSINQYSIMAANIREATGAYQGWLNAQNVTESGEMANQAQYAIGAIKDTFDPNSNNFQRTGTATYKAAVEFLIPDTVPEDEVQEYINNLESYFTDDKSGADKFIAEALDKGLMEYDPDTGHVNIAADKTMSDFTEAFNWTDEAMQAMFGELQEFEAVFDWGDEINSQPLDTLVLSAENANETLKGLEATDFTFDFDTSNMDSIESQIDQAEVLLSELSTDEDGNINLDLEGAREAQAILAALLQRKNELSQPSIMYVDTNQVDGAIGDTIQTLQEFQLAQQNLEILQTIGADTSVAEAEVDSLVGKIQNTDPQILKKLKIDTTSSATIADSISKITPQMIVNVVPNLSAINDYSPDNKSAKINYSADFTNADRAQATNKNAKVLYTAIWNYAVPLNKVKTGSARSSGSWGISKNENALVGELGQELVVRNGHFFTIGNNGPEFVSLKAGDIVFNHRQTKDLLSIGRTSGRGYALVDGTAMVTGGGIKWSPYGGIGGISSNYTQTYSSNSQSSTAARDLTKTVKQANNEFEETVDWIEKLRDVTSTALDRIKKVASDIYQLFHDQNKELDKAITQARENIKINQQAYDRYLAQANATGLSSEYRQKVQNGTLDIQQITDENLKNQIDEYEKWWNLAEKVKDEIADLNTELDELGSQKLDNIIDDFDKLIDRQDAIISKAKSSISLKESKGLSASIKDYETMIASQQQTVNYLKKEYDNLNAELNQLTASGTVIKYSDTWDKYNTKLLEIESKLNDVYSDIEENKDSIRDIRWDSFNKGLESIDHTRDSLRSLTSLIEESGLLDDYGNFTNSGKAMLGLYAQELANSRKEVQEYSTAIATLKKELANGVISQDEFNEQLAEYEKKQLDAIESTKDARDAILKLVKDGIEKETEAYEKLIDKKKEDLDKTKESKDFQEEVAEREKEIAKIERKLAGLSTDNSREATAERKKLEEELAEKRKDLEDYYFDYNIDQQKEALNKDLEAFKESQEKLEKDLDINPDIQNEAIADALKIPKDDYNDVYQYLKDLAKIYGVELSNDLTKPWSNGTAAANQYKEAIDAIFYGTNIDSSAIGNSLTTQNEKIVQELYEQLLNRGGSSSEIRYWVDMLDNAYTPDDVIAGIKNSDEYKKLHGISDPPPTDNSSPQNSTPTSIWDGLTTWNGNRNALNYTNSLADRMKWHGYDGSNVANRARLWKNLGLQGEYSQTFANNDFLLRELLKRGYAQGKYNIPHDQLALTQEKGLEAIWTKHGLLTPLKKGDSVFNAEQTKALFDFTKNPEDFLVKQLFGFSLPSTPNVSNHTQSMNIESLITVNGNVDGNNMKELTYIAQNIAAKEVTKAFSNFNHNIFKNGGRYRH